MHQCCVFGCRNEANHSFPKDENLRKLWESAIHKDFVAKKYSKICAAHFKTEDFIKVGRFSGLYNTRRILQKGIVPSIFQCTKTEDIKSKQRRERAEVRKAGGLVNKIGAPEETMVTIPKTSTEIVHEYIPNQKVSEKEAQPGPSKILDARTSLHSGGREQDALSQVVQQCRFCGEFSKDCAAVSLASSYLAGNKTALALNAARVQLDFGDRSLPQTVCRHCDAKLQEFCDFVHVVKAAQGTLIKVAEEKAELETVAKFEKTTADFKESTAKYEEIEAEVVKTEDSYDDKEAIIDSFARCETEFVNKTNKRKSDTDNLLTAEPKKLKAEEKYGDYLVITIKEEVVEKDTNEQSEVSDTETDVKPSELELTKSDLVFKMAGDGTSECQGYRSDR